MLDKHSYSISDFPETKLQDIINQLDQSGFAVADDFISNETLSGLLGRIISLDDLGLFEPTESLDERFVSEKVNYNQGQRLYFTEEEKLKTVVIDLMDQLHHLATVVSEHYQLSITIQELHYSVFFENAVYSKHTDSTPEHSNRKFSFLIYLNNNWEEESGGALKLFPYGDEEAVNILPLAARLVIFDSEKIPHEVLAAKRNRYAIKGYFSI